ncbi:MAG: hypothetical protein DMG12_16710 [Acidobacteria bacterium]|nr:MAG: hypothetical protein DMG12_16710 [Acidobacteriota bacterium]
MKRDLVVILGLCIGLLLAAVPVLAHHALAAEFDSSKPVKFTGTVKSVDWMNPHIYVNIESKDETGKNVVYSVEGGPPNSLYRNGWRKDSLKPGDVVQVSGMKAKKADSNRIGNARIVTADGKAVFRNGPEQ